MISAGQFLSSVALKAAADEEVGSNHRKLACGKKWMNVGGLVRLFPNNPGKPLIATGCSKEIGG